MAASGYVDQVIASFAVKIVNPFIQLLFALALGYFVFGIAQYMRGAAEPAARDTGRKHMLWGIVGMAIMVSVFGIIRLVVGNVGATPPSIIPAR